MKMGGFEGDNKHVECWHATMAIKDEEVSKVTNCRKVEKKEYSRNSFMMTKILWKFLLKQNFIAPN